MGLYGNITNTSNTHFQFDKIYPNRYTMEAKITEDNIFSGRFVLIEYDSSGNFSNNSILTGYLNPEDNNDSRIYFDKACTKPYIYVDFTPVSSLVAANWNKYFLRYESDGQYYYFRLPSEEYFNINETNYFTVIGNISSDDFNRVITTNEIVCIRNSNGALTSTFYKCLRGEIQGQDAPFEEIGNLSEYNTYFKNFMIDKNYYGDFAGAYLNRGYDATVWQKEYGEGIGRYVLIAHLNGLVPAIELAADAPSEQPQAPYIDSFSTNELVLVRSPSMWGFRLKPAGDNDLSDMIGEQTDYVYDNQNNIVSSETAEKRLAVYFNKDGAEKETSNIDSVTENEIVLEPTGSSGKFYSGQVANDIQELTIHVPAIGNMIAEGYDLFYGKDLFGKRYLDTEWYNANDAAKDTGVYYLNGKTFDLNTVAGCINTFHNRLGQVIQELETYPSNQEIDNQLSPNVIYYIQSLQKYYRKMKTYSYKAVDNSAISYSLVNPPLSADQYETNTYYVYNNGAYYIATDNFSSSESYWQKNIEADVFKLIDPPLVKYEPNKFYRKIGNNYYLDISSQPSSSQRQSYFTIANEDVILQNLTREYRANAYYTIGTNLDLILSMAQVPDSTLDYYTIDQTIQNYINVIFYEANTFFYYDENNILQLDDSNTVTQGRTYYYYVFSDTPVYGKDEQGRTIAIYPIDETKTQGPFIGGTNLVSLPANTSNLYSLDNNTSNYILYSNVINQQPINGIPARLIPRNYSLLSLKEVTNELYVANKFYIKEGNDYIISSTGYDSEQNYYLIMNTSQITADFYLPGIYYYKDTGDVYKIDYSTYKREVDYYQKQNLFVVDDSSGRWPQGYEWHPESLFVPASVTLGVQDEQWSFKELEGINNGKTSLNGLILEIDKFLDNTNQNSRDLNTLNGTLNKIKDVFYSLRSTALGNMVYFNEFGQLASTGFSYKELLDLKDSVLDLQSRVEALES